MSIEQKDKVLIQAGLRLGCDPEFFFRDKKTGKIVPSEQVIPPKGFTADYSATNYVIRDGVQAEINVSPSYCRQLLRSNIRAAFDLIRQKLNEQGKHDIVCDMNTQVVRLTKKEMDALSDESKQLGCNPSYNIYDSGASTGISDPTKYMYRSAGGHLHLGQGGSVSIKTLQNVKLLVPLLDLIVGNTCVMIDRDKGNIIRRRVYGRAGEFRLPKYGIEYRTLSNFWLKNYTLMSLVTGLARVACLIAQHKPEYATHMLSLVNQEEVIRAINNNNKTLAKKNWDKIKDYLVDVIYDVYNQSPVNKNNLAKFDAFMKSNDISKLFKDGTETEWTCCKSPRGKDYNNYSFENFLTTYTVKKQPA